MRKILLIICFAILIILPSCSKKNELALAEPVWAPEEEESVSTPKIEETIEEKEPIIHTVKMRVVGDIMVHKWQVWAANNKKNNQYDFDEQFSLIKPLLEDADITIGNLETTFGGSKKGYSGYPRFNTPDSLADSLKEVGFDLVTTSNNHSMDTNSQGNARTLDILDNAGLEHVGTYRNQAESEKIKIKEIDNISFGFLSYTYGTNGIPVPKDQKYMVNLIDLEKIKKDIEKAKKLSPDFIVIYLHFGQEYQKYPSQNQKEIVDELIKAGADIILGGHPHVVQPMEVREVTCSNGIKKKGFVIYSLGNFISSQRTPLDPPRDAGMILNLDFEKVDDEKAKIKTISFMPTWVQFSNRNGKRTIRVIGSNLSIEEMKANLAQWEINRLQNTKEYTLRHLLGEKEYKLEDDFYIYPFDLY